MLNIQQCEPHPSVCCSVSVFHSLALGDKCTVYLVHMYTIHVHGMLHWTPGIRGKTKQQSCYPYLTTYVCTYSCHDTNQTWTTDTMLRYVVFSFCTISLLGLHARKRFLCYTVHCVAIDNFHVEWSLQVDRSEFRSRTIAKATKLLLTDLHFSLIGEHQTMNGSWNHLPFPFHIS